MSALFLFSFHLFVDVPMWEPTFCILFTAITEKTVLTSHTIMKLSAQSNGKGARTLHVLFNDLRQRSQVSNEFFGQWRLSHG